MFFLQSGDVVKTFTSFDGIRIVYHDEGEGPAVVLVKMFLSFFIPVGVFLLLAARRPSEHRSIIALAAWWNISYGVVMAIQTVEARIHGVHRDFTMW